jgi:hypothetical protein
MPKFSIKQPYNFRCSYTCFKIINIFNLVVSHSILHVNSSVIYINIYMLVLSECNDLYFIAIALVAFIAFTLNEIKQFPFFLGHPVV